MRVIVTAGDLDCFFDIGSYKLCETTLSLSIYSSLLFLMTQAFVSRILVPGMSNFVNASVCRLILSVSRVEAFQLKRLPVAYHATQCSVLFVSFVIDLLAGVVLWF